MIFLLSTTIHTIKPLKESQYMLKVILLLSIMEFHSMKNLIKKILNLKWVIMSEFHDFKMYLLKDIHLIGGKKFLLLKK